MCTGDLPVWPVSEPLRAESLIHDQPMPSVGPGAVPALCRRCADRTARLLPAGLQRVGDEADALAAAAAGEGTVTPGASEISSARVTRVM